MGFRWFQIIRGGRHAKLTFQNRKDYVAAAVQTRAHECHAQVEAILEGLSIIVPLPLLKLLSAADLKVLCPSSSPKTKTVCDGPSCLGSVLCAAPRGSILSF